MTDRIKDDRMVEDAWADFLPLNDANREGLRRRYEELTADLPREVRRFIEDELVTRSGLRDSVAKDNALGHAGITEEVITTLLTRRLLQVHERLGVQRLELADDVLLVPVCVARDVRSPEKSNPAVGATRRTSRLVTAALVGMGMLVVVLLAAAGHYRQSTHTLLSVEQVTPDVRQPVDPQTKQIRWTFNLDVDQNDLQSPGTVTPPVAGRWLWEDARTLCFLPEDVLPRATSVKIALLPEHVHTPQGVTLPAPYVTAFKTASLGVQSVQQVEYQDDRFVLQIKFTDKVQPAELRSALRLQAEGSWAVDYQILGQQASDVIRIRTDSRVQASALAMRIAGSLTGLGGPEPMGKDYEAIIPLQRVLAFTSAEGRSGRSGPSHIALDANSPFDHKLLAGLLRVDPAIPFEVNSSSYSVSLIGDFQPGTRYAVTMLPPAAEQLKGKVPRPGTFSVLVPDREPSAWFEHDEGGYLGSRGNRTILTHAMNISEMRVSIWRMYDNNIAWWASAHRYSRNADDYARPLAQRKLPVRTQRNVVQDFLIKLDEVLPPQDRKDGVYRVELEGLVLGDDGRDNIRDEESVVVTLSDIGLTAKQSENGLVVWAASLANATPMAGVRMQAYSNKNQLLGEGVTTEDGLAEIRLAKPADKEQLTAIVAQRPGTSEMTWLAMRGTDWDLAHVATSGRPYLTKGCEAYLYTDRGAYRPGDTVCLRSVVRDASLRPPQPFPVRWLLRRPGNHDWRSHSAVLDADGAAEWKVDLPADVMTGQWQAVLEVPGTPPQVLGSADMLVEEFVPTRVKASVRLGDQAGAGEPQEAVRRVSADAAPIALHVQGDYLFGQPAAGLTARLNARLTPATFAPKGWEQFSFGDSAKIAETSKRGLGEVSIDGTDKGDVTLDEKGAANLKIGVAEFDSEDAAPASTPYRLWVQASVLEPGGRPVSVSDAVLVDRVAAYIGVRPPVNGTLKPGVDGQFDIVAVNPHGVIDSSDRTLKVKLFREVWNSTLVHEDGHYRYDSQLKREEVASPVSDVTLEDGRGTLQLRLTNPGSYVLMLCHAQDSEEPSATVRFQVVSGSDWQESISREHPEALDLSFVAIPPDRPASQPSTQSVVPATLPTTQSSTQPTTQSATQPTTQTTTQPSTTQPTSQPADPASQPVLNRAFDVGERIGVLVRSPFAGRLLLTIETDHVLWSKVVEMTGTATIVPITVSQQCLPNAYVTATVVRGIDPDAKWRVHRAFGVLTLPVSRRQSAMEVQVTAPPEMKPDGALDVTLLARTPDGQIIANAAIAVAAVDEGILQLTDFSSPDPLNFFFAKRALGTTSLDIYGQLMPEVPRPVSVSPVGGSADDEEPEMTRNQTMVTARRVKPVALVSDIVHTDAAGKAQLRMMVPPFAGRLRVMAVGYSPDRLGAGKSDVVVRSPLVVQSSFPRFLAPGDRCDVTLTVFNNTEQEGEVILSAQAMSPVLGFGEGASDFKSEPVTLKAGTQRTITMPLKAAATAGVANIRVSGQMAGQTTSEEVEIPVRPAAPTITRGGYLEVSPDRPQKVDLRSDMLVGTRDVAINVTPWPTLNLPAGLDYLERYPYGCAEQTISASFPLVYLSDVGARIAPGAFEPQRVKEKLQSSILRLMALQTADGGIGMWPGASESWPWGTVYAAHFLIEAEHAGHVVPADFRDRVLLHLQGMLREMADGDEMESQAYACYVLALAGKPPRPVMSRIGDISRSGPSESAHQRAQARLYLALAWIAAGKLEAAEAMIPQTLPQPRSQRQDGGNLGSPVRDRAMLVNALLEVNPRNPAIPALVQQLADAGRGGQWRSTQDCAFAMMAIGRYLRHAHDERPVTQVRLLAGDHSIAAADPPATIAWAASDRNPGTTMVPDELSAQASGPAGSHAYLTWQQTGVPMQPPSDADHGMAVRRRYLREKDKKPADLADVRSGELLVVELTIQSPEGQRNLVIEDLLPAGLEVENPRLATSAKPVGDALPTAPLFLRRRGNAWHVVPLPVQDSSVETSFEPDYLDIRDDRVVLMGDMPYGGSAIYRYLVRAVTPGAYVVPPVRGECMYDLGVNSINGGGGTLTVKSGHAQ